MTTTDAESTRLKYSSIKNTRMKAEEEGEWGRGYDALHNIVISRRAHFLGGNPIGIDSNVAVAPLRIRPTTTSSHPRSTPSATAAIRAECTTGKVELECSTA
jgi:hypothetical protein